MLEPRRLAARLAARFVAAEMRRAGGRDRRLPGAVRGGRRAAHAPALPHRGRADAPPALATPRSIAWDAWCSTNSTSATWRATWRWRCCAACNAPGGPTCAWWSCRPRSMPRPSPPISAGARVMRSEGRQYPLEIEYTPHSAAPLEAAGGWRAGAARGARTHVARQGTCWCSCPARPRSAARRAACARAGAAPRLAAAAAAWRSIARGAGPRRAAVRSQRRSSSRPTWRKAPSPSTASPR